MRRVRPWALIAGLLSLSACETEECRRLNGMIEQYQEALDIAERRARNAERFQKQAKDAQTQTEATLARLGLDRSEEALVADLDKRLSALSNATYTRRVESYGPAEEAESNAKTIFTISFSAKDLVAAWAGVEALIQPLPLWRLEYLRAGEDPGRWQVELARAVVERLPIKPTPTPLPELPAPSSVPTQLGLCGAGRARTELEAIRAKIDALREKASSTTVLLPTIASWKGLEQRAQVLERVELQSRALQKLLVETALATKSRLKAVGYQEPRAVLEVLGGKKERESLERALVKHRSILAVPESKPQETVVRVTLTNVAVPEFRREPAPGVPGAPVDPHQGHDHGPGGH